MIARRFVLLASIASVFALPATETTSTVTNTPAETTPVSISFPAPSASGGANADSYYSPAWIPYGQNLKPHLSQNKTNGKSVLGTVNAPKLPYFLTNNPLPNGYPWGTHTVANTDPYTVTPSTGVTRYYDFTISRMTIAPDGVAKDGIVINGAFPGPTIEANWGDYIEVTVTNDLGDEGTALHWHGLLQTASPWMDGVPAVMQCPIPPGGSFTYRFQADLYGTSWYHSHYSAQYAGGLLGPMVIYGPHDNAAYDVDLGPIFVTDWYHDDYFSLVEQTMAPASENLLPVVSNNNLINGKANYPCTDATNGTTCISNAGISKFYFETGKTYRLRLINGGAEGIQKFSIDNHQMTIIAQDFVPVVPYEVDVVTLGIGQRTDIIVTATGEATDSVWMRSTLGTSAFVGGCTLNDGIAPEAVAAIYYQNATNTTVPTTDTSVTSAQIETCANDPLTDSVPYYDITPAATPATTEVLNVEFLNNGTNNLFYVNNSTFRADYNDPILLEAKLGNNTWEPDWNVYDFGSNNTVRLVIYNFALAGAHPIHFHGHNFFVLAEGTGTWDGTVTNANNPSRRDVQLLQNAASATVPSYLVMQWDANNPGVWPLHCHIAWHVSAGLYINVLEQPDEIVSSMAIPSTMAQTCRDWASWTGVNVVMEIDSGL